MLRIVVPARESDELWDEKNQEFVYVPACKEQVLQLEHSLVSISKWESKWCKSFFSKEEKTREEAIDYIRCMTITQNVDPHVYDRLSDENFEQVNDYIKAPMTATKFFEENPKKTVRETVTSELIYYWMIALNIPPVYEKWHFNRLITLIKVCEIKNTPPKKRSRSEIASRNAALNAKRKKQLHTRG